MKRSRAKEPLQWQDYVEDDTLAQLSKLATVSREIPELQSSWYYQYVISWLYVTTKSYYTIEENKAMWNDIKFDECLLMRDIQEPFGNKSEDNLYDLIRLQLLKLVSNNKGAQLKDWDVAVKYNLQSEHDQTLSEYTEGNATFHELTLSEQFRVLYRCIKQVERKNMVFKNYLVNHPHLFQFPELSFDERALLILPAGKIIEKVMESPENNLLQIPIKLSNCTVTYEEEIGVQGDKVKTKEVVHYDYSPEIDNYIASVTVDFTPLTHGWESFLEYLSGATDPSLQGFLAEAIPTVAAHEVYARKLHVNREKERSMAELLVRRKRSSRLVAREEELQKKELESEWDEKLDNREQFVRERNKLVGRKCKKIKDLLWGLIWDKFEQDLKVEKIKRRTADMGGESTPEPVQNSATPLTLLDQVVLDNGEKFHSRIVDIATPAEPLQVDSLELPDELLITHEELAKLANHGIPVDSYAEDDTSWYFQCLCGVTEKQDGGKNHEEENELVRGHTIICCDMCLRWQHWECQTEATIDLLSQGHPRVLQAKDFDTVVMGNVHQRRSNRRQQQQHSGENEPTERPASKRKLTNDSETFICGWCLRKLEEELRGVFVPELTAIREKQHKQQEDRDRRKRLKEEKKRLEEQQQQQTTDTVGQVQPVAAPITAASVTVPVSTVETAVSVIQQQQQQQQQQHPNTSPRTEVMPPSTPQSS